MPTRIAAAAALCLLTGAAQAFNIPNAGLNDQSSWTLENDATLGFAGGQFVWNWQTPIDPDSLVQGQETVLPTEGDGFGIVYAGGDAIKQLITIDTAGEYTVSVCYNGVLGRFINPSAGSSTPLVEGSFDLLLGARRQTVDILGNADGWQTASFTTFLNPGLAFVGVETSRFASYAIAFDDFQLIPAPSAASAALLGLALAARRRR